MSWRFRPVWRERRSAGFVMERDSTARALHTLRLWGQPLSVYANANLSVYSAEPCNAACAFCVEELRPASRGRDLASTRRVEPDDQRWLERLDQTLSALAPLDLSVSITGGEPSRDPRLPAALRLVARHGIRKRTLTTNASGLTRVQEGRAIIDHVVAAGLHHLNISRAHPDADRNAQLMAMRDGLDDPALRQVVARARAGGVSVRLSCVLLQEGVGALEPALDYLRFARNLGVDQVIFRELMHPDPATTRPVGVARYSARQRVDMGALVRRFDTLPGARLLRQVMGYYYYVEVWRIPVGDAAVTVCVESADLAHIEREKAAHPGRVHELVFHPDAALRSTWQPWDPQLGPPAAEARGQAYCPTSQPMS